MPGTPATLDRGEYIEFESTADFAVTASGPVQVARLNTGSTGGKGNADPAMTLMLPPERFMTSAVFWLPDEPFMFNFVDIVARPGTTVWVDGAAVPGASFTPVGTSGFSHAQLPEFGRQDMREVIEGNYRVVYRIDRGSILDPARSSRPP